MVSKTMWFYSFFGFLKLADYIGLEVGTGWKIQPKPTSSSIYIWYNVLMIYHLKQDYMIRIEYKQVKKRKKTLCARLLN